MKKIFIATLGTLMLTACSVSYSFQGTSIDYNKIKTMEITDFTNQAPLVYAPLIIQLNENIKDFFTKNTKLSFVDAGGDLELEGEIVRYDLTPLAVKETNDGTDIRASQTRLTMAVRIRFRNNVNPEEDKEETITAYRDFDSSKMLEEVQDELIKELNNEVVDQIFNSTRSNW